MHLDRQQEQAKDDTMPDSDTSSVSSAQRPTTKPNDLSAQASWKTLFAFTSNAHAAPLLASTMCAFAAGTIKPIQSVIIGRIFDQFTKYGGGSIGPDDFRDQIAKYSLVMTGLGIATWVFYGSSFGCWVATGELHAKSARLHIFSSLLRKPIGWFDTRKSGIAALVPRVQSQIWELQLASSQPLGGFVQQAATAVASLIIAFYYSWNLALVTICSAPIMAGCLMLVSARIQPSIKDQQEALAKASKCATSALSSIETVKCFNGQQTELERYTSAISRAAQAYFKQAAGISVQLGFLRCMLLLVFVQGFWYGHHLVVIGRKSTGDVVTTIWAALLATEALEAIMPQIIVLEKGRAAGAQLRALVHAIESTQDSQEGIPGEKAFWCRGDICVRNVSFSYPARPSQLALCDVNLDIHAGETTFVIGKSGSGKSTLGQLLMRFYEPSTGSVQLDGNLLDKLDVKWLRSNITLVEQNSVLFKGTLRENIAYGRSSASPVTLDDIKSAAEFALLSDTINDLPQGLDTQVSSRGTSLSGGQRQRMALARARLRDSPILILDESASALDHISRSLIMTAVRKWRNCRTTIVITHDISQIGPDDRVLVMEDGRLVQHGYRRLLDAGPNMPFHKFTRVVDAEDVLESTESDMAFENDPGSFEDIDIILAPPKTDHPQRDYLVPSVFRDGRSSMMLQPTTTNWQQTLAEGSLNKAESLNAIARQTTNARGLDQVEQKTDHRLSQSTMQLIDHAGQKAVERRLGMVAMHEQNPTSGQDNDAGLAEREATGPPVPSMAAILSTIWPVLSHRGRMQLLAGIFCTLVHAAATPLFSWIFSKLITTFYAQDGGSADALRYSVGAIAISVVDGISVFFLHLLLETCGQNWVDSKRKQAMRKILDQPREFLSDDKNNVATIVANLDRSAEEMRNLLGRFAAFIFMGAIILAASLIWAMAESWKLTLVGLSVAPVSFAATRAFQKVSSAFENACNNAADVGVAIMSETFTNIKTVRSLTLEERFQAQYVKAGQHTLIVGLKRAIACGFFHGLSESLVLFVSALVFYYGAVLAASGENSVASLLTVFSMLLFGLSNVTAVLNYIPQIASSKDTAQRLLDLVDLPQNSHEHRGANVVYTLGDISFNNLVFAYPRRPNDFVLCGLNFRFQRGISTALVGPSGSGKSTVASLLLRLYPAPLGAVGKPPPLMIGGQSISSIATESLRSCIAIVPQTAVIFPASVADNITYGLPQTSPLRQPHNVERAARDAGIDTFIQSLPHGYATLLGDGGAGLSGGQAQRIAIARALVRNPAALLLDEATSALDVQSATLIRDTVQRLRSNQPDLTVIMITHDEAMMRMADTVVMLDKGRVVDQGPFEELMERRGAFANLIHAGQLQE